jgi:hypothetical protein
MIASASSLILELGARFWKVSRPSGSYSLVTRIEVSSTATSMGSALKNVNFLWES